MTRLIVQVGWCGLLIVGCAGATLAPASSTSSAPTATPSGPTGSAAPSAVPSSERACAQLNRYHVGNCEAPLTLTEEVTRLLATAAAHATRSSACVDGPGTRATVSDLLVCRIGNDPGGVDVSVSYTVTLHPEGDTRGCNRVRDCDWLEPARSDHCVVLHFTRADQRATLQLPSSLPGLDGTPLDRAHDGDCYGPSGPFVPRPVELAH